VSPALAGCDLTVQTLEGSKNLLRAAAAPGRTTADEVRIREVGRTIVVGDVHGCLRELEALLAEVRPAAGDDLWFLGDLVNRGPDSAGVVRLVRGLGARMVQGNHDHRHVRYRRHLERLAAGRGYRIPMRPSEPFLAVHRTLSDEDIAWLEAAPTVAPLGPHFALVHAGLLPGLPLGDQPAPRTLRYLDRETGRMVDLAAHDAAPGRTVHWSERWTGPRCVIYGHHAQPEAVVRALSIGIDTGAVYGGKLTAAVLESLERRARPRLVQVAAAQAYYRGRA
jgi:hypothetical protein